MGDELGHGLLPLLLMRRRRTGRARPRVEAGRLPGGPDVQTGRETGLFIFARFHARPGNEAAVKEALLEVLAKTREEPGCLSIHDYRSIRDPQLCYIHSRRKDEAAFERHAELPHTVRFLERVQPRIDHPLDVARTERIA
jgi:quinol monooxygenase YgiN